MPAIDKWLTPDAPASGFICRRVLIPNSVDFLAIVSGALLELTKSYNFEQFGTLSPKETAELFFTMFDDFTFEGDRGCRMIGEIIPFAGASVPDPTWLLCDGASLLRVDYPGLFAVIGTTYGAVDGSHFNIPDLRGRAPIGAGTGTGLSARALGDYVGEETHTLITSEIPSHTHVDTGHAHAEVTAIPTLIAIGAGVPAASAVPGAGVTGIGNSNLSNTGGDGSHNNIQPSLAINFFIVAG